MERAWCCQIRCVSIETSNATEGVASHAAMSVKSNQIKQEQEQEQELKIHSITPGVRMHNERTRINT